MNENYCLFVTFRVLKLIKTNAKFRRDGGAEYCSKISRARSKTENMEHALKELTAQFAELKKKLEALKSTTDKNETHTPLVRHAVNPPTVLTTEMNYDVWKRLVIEEN